MFMAMHTLMNVLMFSMLMTFIVSAPLLEVSKGKIKVLLISEDYRNKKSLQSAGSR